MTTEKRAFAKAVDGIVTMALAAAASCAGSTTDGSNGAASTTSSSSGAIFAPVGALTDAGSDGGTVTPFPDEASFGCQNPLSDLAAGLHPATPVDYLEARVVTSPHPSLDAGAGPYVAPTSSVGTPCAKASDLAACTANLRRATSTGWDLEGILCGPAPYDKQFLVYTRGDQVGSAATAAEVASLLAPIDSPEEARVVLLASQDVSLRCLDSDVKSGWRRNADGSYEIIAIYGGCPTRRTRYRIETSGDLSIVADQKGNESCICGRRFEGLADVDVHARHGLGEHLAKMAYLEAASVVAFRRFEEDLRELGAPRELLARTRRARADEIRHAGSMGRLARRAGAPPRRVEATPRPRRSAVQVAIENAVEGCVRETFGALVATHQARAAGNEEIRATMIGVAADEVRHAELARDVAAWLEPRLATSERTRVVAAKRRAVWELRAAIEVSPPADVVRLAGVPSVSTARQLLDGLTELGV
jgi:hypothetical protein